MSFARGRHVERYDVALKPGVFGEGASIHTREGEKCPDIKEVMTGISDNMNRYEVTVREGITVMMRFGDDAQASLFLSYAVVTSEPPAPETYALHVSSTEI